ncbi:MAG: diguanylate cyclase domain-containing protein [Halomonas sp.]
MDESHHTRLHALLYFMSALLLLGQALWHYLMGDFARILLPALLAPLLVTAALMHLGQAESSRLSAYLVLICGYLMVAVELPLQPGQAAFWLGLPPLLTLLLLPLGPAMLLNVTLTPIWLLLGDSQLGLDLVLAYLSLVVVAGLAPWELLHQRALLQATDPVDAECAALKAAPLEARLLSECERAELLGQRLAVLMIHLPQLEMAGEQFGARARLALLTTLCRVVQQLSRDHDLLGREGDADFWLVLPDTSDNGALLVRQRIEEALHRTLLLDTGEVETRMMISHLRAAETPGHFLQRLHARTQRLAET